jgi:hypothetical protein
MDVSALVEVMMPRTMKMLEAMREGRPAPDWDRTTSTRSWHVCPTNLDEKVR